MNLAELNRENILCHLSSIAQNTISQVDILQTIDSTNNYLLNKANLISGYVCLAEQQTAGRGRQNKTWYSPQNASLYLSLSWQFDNIKQITGLSLVIGIAVINALKRYGPAEILLKWPNDIIYQFKKLGGILIEIKNPAMAIIGIGLNIKLASQANETIQQPWTDISSLIKETPDRNKLAGYILNECLLNLLEFQQSGFTNFQTQWQQLDALAGKAINIHTNEGIIAGIAEGIDSAGNLIANINGIRQPLNSGEVSIRLKD